MVKLVVFDAYGTLFDVTAAARGLAQSGRFPAVAPVWEAVARDWRDKQVGYSWLLAAAGEGGDFWVVTEAALDWALAAQGLGDEPGLRAGLLDLYWQLAPYPEVAEVLAAVKAKGVAVAILSNGTAAMVEAAVVQAGIAAQVDAVLSAADVGTFKPDPRVYAMVGARFDVPPGEVLFVSSNGWDIGFAGTHGFRTLWVNRFGAPVERLPAVPGAEAQDLRGVLRELEAA